MDTWYMILVGLWPCSMSFAVQCGLWIRAVQVDDRVHMHLLDRDLKPTKTVVLFDVKQ